MHEHQKSYLGRHSHHIQFRAFSYCMSLAFIKLSIYLDSISAYAFIKCNLSSVFVPPNCTFIGSFAFENNCNLEILNVPDRTVLEDGILGTTMLFLASLYDGVENDHEKINTMIKDIKADEKIALHKVCSSFEPSLDVILDTMEDKGGLKAFNVKNSICITPSRYLKENPFADATEKEMVEIYIIQMMG